jgi:hypothetical protein
MSTESADDGTHPEIPDKSWTNPFVPGTYLHDLYAKRVRQERDLIMIVDDFNAGRGTGKTVGSLQLGNGMDRAGGLTKDKSSISPMALREAYVDEPKGSGLVLDEAEVGVSNRQAMTKVNQALREIMSMGRVEQKYVVVNAPSRDFIDKDIQKLADVWISMTNKGRGLVHELRNQPYQGTLLTEKKQWITFEDIPSDHDLRDVYRHLTQLKRKRMDGGDGKGFVPAEEHQRKVKRARQKAAKRTRDDLLHQFYTHPEIADVPQRVLADCAGLEQATVSDILAEQRDK